MKKFIIQLGIIALWSASTLSAKKHFIRLPARDSTNFEVSIPLGITVKKKVNVHGFETELNTGASCELFSHETLKNVKITPKKVALTIGCLALLYAGYHIAKKKGYIDRLRPYVS